MTPVTPIRLYSKPANTGAMVLANGKDSSMTAFKRSRRSAGINRVVVASRAGPWNVPNKPCINETTYKCQGWNCPEAKLISKNRLPSACPASERIITALRDQRSTSAPARLPTNIPGSSAKKEAKSSGAALPVSVYIQMPMAIEVMRLPISETVWVTSKIKKVVKFFRGMRQMITYLLP